VATESDCPFRLERVSAVSGLNLSQPSAGGSRTVQADVAASGGGRVEISILEQVITECIQQALGDFFERAPEIPDAVMTVLIGQGPMQAVVVQELHQQMPQLCQALVAMVVTEAQIAGAINGDNEMALATKIVQGLHADEPLVVAMEQLGEGRAADMPNKMIEGLGHRQRLLLGAGQLVEIM